MYPLINISLYHKLVFAQKYNFFNLIIKPARRAVTAQNLLMGIWAKNIRIRKTHFKDLLSDTVIFLVGNINVLKHQGKIVLPPNFSLWYLKTALKWSEGKQVQSLYRPTAYFLDLL